MAIAPLDSSDQWLDAVQTLDGEFEGEHARFQMIFHRHAVAVGKTRHELRDELLLYLRFSPQQESLINQLIEMAVDLPCPDRLEIAIDILSQLGDDLFNYAHQFLIRDVDHWNRLYVSRAYQPDEDYWYVLLRSVAQAEVSADKQLRFVTSCLSKSTRRIAEAVVEALGDIESSGSQAALVRLVDHEDRFIANLAKNVLEDQ